VVGGVVGSGVGAGGAGGGSGAGWGAGAGGGAGAGVGVGVGVSSCGRVPVAIGLGDDACFVPAPLGPSDGGRKMRTGKAGTGSVTRGTCTGTGIASTMPRWASLLQDGSPSPRIGRSSGRVICDTRTAAAARGTTTRTPEAMRLMPPLMLPPNSADNDVRTLSADTDAGLNPDALWEALLANSSLISSSSLWSR
jgi:hypothetical protein